MVGRLLASQMAKQFLGEYSYRHASIVPVSNGDEEQTKWWGSHDLGN